MSVEKEAKKKKKQKGAEVDNRLLSWQLKKTLADKEEEMTEKEVEELVTWTSLIETMDEQQLKEYVSNEKANLQNVKSGPGKRIQRSGKSKCSDSSGLMAAVWKFHREDDEERSHG